MADRREPPGRDWAGDRRTLALLWGVPAAAMLVSAFLGPPTRAAIWTAMLVWMGCACIANARRCCRTHCRFTGPFFLLMAACVIAYANGVLALGPHGWSLLGSATFIGAALRWWGSERRWGRFTPS